MKGMLGFLISVSFVIGFSFFAQAGSSAPLWSFNLTSPASPQIYNTANNYSFQINWTGGDNNFANATFRLGSPGGGLTNYTDNTTGLVGYWKLDSMNSTNYTKDFSGYGNDGNLGGGSAAASPHIVNGKVGGGMEFDDADDYINVGDAIFEPLITGNITIETWVYWKGNGTTVDFITSKEKEQYEIHTGSLNNNIRWLPRTGVALDSPAESFQPNQWNHIAVTYDSGTSSGNVYINGANTSIMQTGTGALEQTAAPFYIGRRYNTQFGAFYFNGTIDDVRVYNRSLSAAEVKSQYDMTYPYYVGTNNNLNGTWAINLTQDRLGRAGTYNYTWFGTDITGSQNSSNTVNYVISIAPTSTSLFLNGTQGNRSYNITQMSNFTVSLNVTGKTVNLNTNLSGWALRSGTTPLYNYTQFWQSGIINITGYFAGDENYSSSSATYFANVTGAVSNITVNLALHLGSLFSDDSIQSTATDVCIQDSSWFALTAENPVLAQSRNLTGDYSMNVSAATSDKFYLAVGKGSCINFKRHVTDAQMKKFLSPLKAFSYAKTNLVQFILQFNSTDITNNAHWGKGSYLLSIANQGYNATGEKDNLAVNVVK